MDKKVCIFAKFQQYLCIGDIRVSKVIYIFFYWTSANLVYKVVANLHFCHTLKIQHCGIMV